MLIHFFNHMAIQNRARYVSVLANQSHNPNAHQKDNFSSSILPPYLTTPPPR